MYLPFTSIAQIVSSLDTAGRQKDGWLLCIAHRHSEALPELLAACRREGIPVCGGIFPGLIADNRTHDEGIIAIRLPEGTRTSLARLDVCSVSWETPQPGLSPASHGSAVLLVDNQAPNIAGLLEDVYDQYGGRINQIGAGTGFPDLRREPSLFTSDGVHPNAALLLTLPLAAAVQIRHGWHRVAGPFVASRTRNNLIQELNWEPAADVYHREIARLDPPPESREDEPAYFAAHPLCIAREGGEDVVRDPLRVTDDKALVVLSDVIENSVMYLARGNKDSLAQAACLAVDECGRPDNVEICLMVECFSRALLLGDHFTDELRLIADRIGHLTDRRPEGVLALGEIAGTGRRCLEFHNKTFALALLHRPRSGS